MDQSIRALRWKRSTEKEPQGRSSGGKEGRAFILQTVCLGQNLLQVGSIAACQQVPFVCEGGSGGEGSDRQLPAVASGFVISAEV
jgi:hypothetical protein